MEINTKATWAISVLCIIVFMPLVQILIGRLKTEFPTEYIKAGKPRQFVFFDHRGMKLTAYILFGDYKSILDKKLLTMFHIARIFLIGFLTSLALFIISILAL